MLDNCRLFLLSRPVFQLNRCYCNYRPSKNRAGTLYSVPARLPYEYLSFDNLHIQVYTKLISDALSSSASLHRRSIGTWILFLNISAFKKWVITSNYLSYITMALTSKRDVTAVFTIYTSATAASVVHSAPAVSDATVIMVSTVLLGIRIPAAFKSTILCRITSYPR